MTDNEMSFISVSHGVSSDFCKGYNEAVAKANEIINGQQAEIERLKIEKDNLIRTYAECQAKVVKEFAEGLKGDSNGWIEISVDDIDNLVKEMVGEEE